MPQRTGLLTEPRISPSEDKEFREFLTGAYAAPHLVIDVESNGDQEIYDVRDGRGYGIGIALSWVLPGFTTSALYFPFRHDGVAIKGNIAPGYLSELKRLIETHPCVVFHNAKFDLMALRTMGIDRTGPFYDTMLMAHWIDENLMSKELDYLARHFLQRRKGNDDMFKQAIAAFGWSGCPVEIMGRYSALDAELTLELFYVLLPLFQEQGFEEDDLWKIEQEFVRLISRMEVTGTLVDLALAREQAAEGESQQALLQEQIGYNPGSNKDLQVLLIDKLGLPVVKTSSKTGAPSFDKFAMEEYDVMLQRLDSPLAQQILAYRGWQKATSSYWNAYLRLVSPDGRLRPNYKLHGTKTGRMSCEKPNLQQIPRVGERPWNKLTKSGFIAPEGYRLWEADYSQLEFRLGAAYAARHQPDLELIDIFADPERDVFSEMAAKLGFTRHDTKTLTYTIQYGGGANRISNVFGVDISEGTKIREHWFSAYPGFKRVSWIAAGRCQSNGYVRLWTGRRRHFANPNSESHKAFNAVIQGGAAEIVKRTMLRLNDEVADSKCRMLLQVHDSIVFEIEEGSEAKYGEAIKEVMADVRPDFEVTFKADFHEWGK